MDEGDRSATTPPVTPEALTPWQREVAALVAEGLSNAEIGRRLAIPESTVADHVDQALRTLKARGRLRLAIWSIARGLVIAVAAAVPSASAF